MLDCWIVKYQEVTTRQFSSALGPPRLAPAAQRAALRSLLDACDGLSSHKDLE
jgi:hypothetical protein